jgi:hypothetical protein
MKYRLQIDIDVELNGTDPEDLLNNLRFIAEHAHGHGLFTRATDAELKTYSASATNSAKMKSTDLLTEADLVTMVRGAWNNEDAKRWMRKNHETLARVSRRSLLDATYVMLSTEGQVCDPSPDAIPGLRSNSRLVDTVLGLAREEGIAGAQLGESSDGTAVVVDTDTGDVYALELRNMDAPAKKQSKKSQALIAKLDEVIEKLGDLEFFAAHRAVEGSTHSGIEAKLGVLGKVIDELVAKAHAPLMTLNDQGPDQNFTFEGVDGDALIAQMAEFARKDKEERARPKARTLAEAMKLVRESQEADREIHEAVGCAMQAGAALPTDPVDMAVQMMKDAGVINDAKRRREDLEIQNELQRMRAALVPPAFAAPYGGAPQMGVSNVRAAAAADAVAPVAETVSITRVVTPIFTEGQANVTWAVEPFYLLLQAGNHAIKTPITPALMQAMDALTPE